MPTLSSAIVKYGVASMSDVEQALARQSLYGGDLVTNLLEIVPVSEEQLTVVLAQVHGVQAAATGELPRASEAVLRLVPGDLSQRQGAYPLGEREGTLLLAVSELLPAEVEEDLGFALGVRIEQRTAPLVRIRQAIARDYGLPLDRRMLRLLAKLEGRPDPSPSSIPGPRPEGAEMVTLPRPDSLPPIAYPPSTELEDGTPTAVRAEILPQPGAATPPGAEAAGTDVAPAAQPPAPVLSQPPSLRLPPHRGPYPAAAAEQDLASASSRDTVMRAFFDFASQYFEYSALFAVHGDLAEGRDARGPGADRSGVAAIGVPLDLPSSLQTVRTEGRWRLARLTDSGLDAGLAKDLQRSTKQAALLLPILVRKRCVLILYGDGGDVDVELSQIGEVIAFAPLVSMALERVILERKRTVLQQLTKPQVAAGQQALQPPAPSGAQPAAGQPGELRHREERAAALAHAVEPPRPARFGPEVVQPAEAMPPPEPSPPPTPAEAAKPSTPPEAAAKEVAEDAKSKAVTTTPTVAIEGEKKPAVAAEPARSETPSPEGAAAEDRDSSPDAGPVFPLKRRSIPAPPDEEPPEEEWDSIPSPPAFAPEESMTAPGLGGEPPRPPSPPAAAPAEPPEASSQPPQPPSVPAAARPSARPARKLQLVVEPSEEEASTDASAEPAPKEPAKADTKKKEARKKRGKPDTQKKEADGKAVSPTSVTEVTSKDEDGPAISIEEASPDSDSPDISVGTAELEDAWTIEAEELAEDGTPVAPPPRTLSYSARRPQRPHESRRELELPTVIVDVESDCRALVNKLVDGDRDAEEQLLQMGEPAISALMEELPEAVAERPHSEAADPRTPASSASPVLRALVRAGQAAVPQLGACATNAEPTTRSWATRLLGEIPSPQSAQALVPRLLDSDEWVARAALEASRGLQSDEDCRRALLQGLSDFATDGTQPVEQRRRILEVWAELHETQAVAPLTKLLEDSSDEVVKSAQAALIVITRQDFGRDSRRWRDWWKRKQGKHRIEWLIDALSHDAEEIRRAAGEELKSLTKEYFGYYHDLPRKERTRAQKRYRHWWETKGRARFR